MTVRNADVPDGQRPFWNGYPSQAIVDRGDILGTGNLCATRGIADPAASVYQLVCKKMCRRARFADDIGDSN
jgi:hypothetical protein